LFVADGNSTEMTSGIQLEINCSCGVLARRPHAVFSCSFINV
jgi:hypothetical protein